jgi:hypothetical protein
MFSSERVDGVFPFLVNYGLVCLDDVRHAQQPLVPGPVEPGSVDSGGVASGLFSALQFQDGVQGGARKGYRDRGC